MEDQKMRNIFISYSWDDESHKSWVKEFADFLTFKGFEVALDQDDLVLGDELPEYMEVQIRSADYILVVCTPEYKRRADERIGGAGYESSLIAGELYAKQQKRKFIPVLREGTWELSQPSFLIGKMGVDFCSGKFEGIAMENLLATLNQGENTTPAWKKRYSQTSVSAKKQESDSINEYVDIKITGILIDQVTLPKMDGTQGSALYKVPFGLSARPSGTWEKLFIQNWNYPSRFTTMHRPRIASVVGKTVVLNGTTIEEVEKYHKATLILAVNAANIQERRMLEEQMNRQELERKREQEHRNHISDIASKITFD